MEGLSSVSLLIGTQKKMPPSHISRAIAIVVLLVFLFGAASAGQANNTRAPSLWPTSVRYFGNPWDYAGTSVAMSESYAAVGVPSGRIFGAPHAMQQYSNGDRNGKVVVWRRPIAGGDDWNWNPEDAANVTASGRVDNSSGVQVPFSDLFGTSIAFNEKRGYMFVGAPRYHGQLENQPLALNGSVFAYRITASNTSATSPPELSEECRFDLASLLQPSNLALRNDSVDSFGYTIATSGDYLAISAPGMLTEADNSARVWIFFHNASLSGCTWKLIQVMNYTERHVHWRSEFGFSLALKMVDDATTLAIGARYSAVSPNNASHELLPAGSVHVYQSLYPGSTFSRLQVLLVPHGQWRSALGSSVDIDDFGTMIIAGAVEDGPNVPDAGRGRAYLYVYNETLGQYDRLGALHDSSGYKYDYFGTAVHFEHAAPHNHCRIAVGSLQTWRSKFKPGEPNGRGAVFVFSCDELPQTEENLPILWTVVSSSARDNGQFGSSIAYDPTSLFVGAPTAPEFIRISPRNITEIPNCGQMWVFDVSRQASLPAWTIALIVVSAALVVAFLSVSVVCLAKRKKQEYITLN